MRLHHELAYRLDKLEVWAMFHVPKILPRRLRYWVLMYEGVGNMRPDEEVPAVPYLTVLQRVGERVR